MPTDTLWDLDDCTELRLTLQARPPRLVHGTLLLLAALLAAALAWAALTNAALVVRAPGRVRPVASPLQVIYGGSGEALSGHIGGRVIEVNVAEGQMVRQGDVLVRLETERLESEIAKRQRTLHASEAEVTQLEALRTLTAQQFAASKAKAEAELAQAREDLRLASARQAAEVRLAEVELHTAQDEAAQSQQLVTRQLVARDELRKTIARVKAAQERVDKARVPVEPGKVEVLRQALPLAEHEYAVRQQELEIKRGLKHGDSEALRIELATLELERQQATIRAPLDGLVTRGEVKVGDLLERGKPVVDIAPQQGFRFEARVPSAEVGHLRLGLPARIKLDAYDYQRYGTVAGTVVFIAPDSSVSAEQGPAIYVVKIALASDILGQEGVRGQVKLGMVGQADIVTGQEHLLTLLLQQIRQSFSLG